MSIKNDIEIVKKACEDVKEKTNKVNSKFLINAINYAKGRNKKSLNSKSEVNPRSFNNFEGRIYNYDTLEEMLLGYIDYDDNDIHDVLSGSNIAI